MHLSYAGHRSPSSQVVFHIFVYVPPLYCLVFSWAGCPLDLSHLFPSELPMHHPWIPKHSCRVLHTFFIARYWSLNSFIGWNLSWCRFIRLRCALAWLCLLLRLFILPVSTNFLIRLVAQVALGSSLGQDILPYFTPGSLCLYHIVTLLPWMDYIGLSLEPSQSSSVLPFCIPILFSHALCFHLGL